MAREELLDHISPIALSEVSEADEATVEKAELGSVLSVPGATLAESLKGIILLGHILGRSRATVFLMTLRFPGDPLTSLLVSLNDLFFRL